MSRLPLVDARTMEKILYNLGFEKVRQKGSHAFYRHADGRTTTIPFHSSKELARPLIRVILNEINLTIEEYGELLKDI
ncbi:putative periplasmic or secreted lipoprotein [Methanomethylovorans hollandica DSM 15978]|jgi:predicted RNA binding protein YcfA (HicA-like mRNA interferase family)|uniref:Putative periplasmic or secreted lipoprotein n=1 Tax=Methanomethylovorans hollandica (strain DSM 15978 / NBRC 107637 / DMS1) TaxID=867904 RepID=L0KWL1_METHD|nr:type II toxin-antitoxin system HicA family toxin [Methanomethylovorans hollandica]AGB48349.1 putative periplasmic or secreted lipoprotein [Methanomethylovorans hollandica DSM 15978]